jgi:hypothetical protein
MKVVLQFSQLVAAHSEIRQVIPFDIEGDAQVLGDPGQISQWGGQIQKTDFLLLQHGLSLLFLDDTMSL